MTADGVDRGKRGNSRGEDHAVITARRPWMLAGALSAALASAPAAALAADVIASKSASGDFAIVVASGHASHPHTLKVKVRTRPRQRATGNWNVVCSKGTGAGSKSGNLSGTGTFTRKLRMPTRNPDDCVVSAGAQLADSGRITVTLLAD
jgi:hypothetical protein